MAMNTLNSLIDQQFVGDIKHLSRLRHGQPGHDSAHMLNEEEMSHLFKAGERATWLKIPAVRMTGRIGRTLDGILHAFEVSEVHWLRASRRPTALPKRSSAG
ncbi:MAG: hypothetical protein IPF49_03530 [Gammaproteobacteria bacterium]|nr:hypothetical protein [Gammaproteobacteria bacterium]